MAPTWGSREESRVLCVFRPWNTERRELVYYVGVELFLSLVPMDTSDHRLSVGQ